MLAKLARKAITEYVKNEKTIKPEAVLEVDSVFLSKKAGTFVTLKKNGDLRACIGTFLPTKENVAQEVIHNAIGAATRDHRFGAVTEDELPELSYEVQVLSKPEPVTDEQDLNPEQYGILVKSIPPGQEDVGLQEGAKSALLLPNLEGIDTTQKQISTACRKAGLPAGQAGITNQNNIKIWRFTTKNFYVHS